jgi:hypothetical protein
VAQNPPAADRLRAYLRDLAPEAQALLLTELERGGLRGEAIPAAEFILAELRRELVGSEQMPRRVGNPTRLFFEPIEPFIIDGAPLRRHDGQIARASLNPIWSWICRDLTPVEAKAYGEATRRALMASDAAAGRAAAHAFQDRVVRFSAKVLASGASRAQARERLDSYMGPPRAIDDLNEMICVLRVRDLLADLGSGLPPSIADFAGLLLHQALSRLGPLVGARDNVLFYALLLVMQRLEAHWQLIRLSIEAAHSNDAVRIAQTPYGVAVTIVLADIEDTVTAMRGKLRSRRPGEARTLLKSAHAAIEAVVVELDLSAASPWRERCAAIRSAIAVLLAGEIETIERGVLELRQRATADGMTPAWKVEPVDMSEAEQAVAFLEDIRSRGAANDTHEQVSSALTRLRGQFAAVASALMAAARRVGDRLRRLYVAQLEIALRLGARLFGSGFAARVVRDADADRRREGEG